MECFSRGVSRGFGGSRNGDEVFLVEPAAPDEHTFAAAKSHLGQVELLQPSMLVQLAEIPILLLTVCVP